MINRDEPSLWPEWNDQIVNDTRWSPVPQRSEPFSDPINHGALPSNVRVAKWRRPTDIYQDPTAPWKIGDEMESFDLILNNQHLFEYKIMRWIISSIMCLEKIGRQNPVDSTYFTYTPGTPEWKPWQNIYGGTKIVKGQVNQPKYNPMGMYYIRLFYMGKWRRITVDDYFPYDYEGRLLLPCTHNKCCLWLQILSKALLRLASVTWAEGEDVVDFSVITCLTGWTQHVLDCRSISTDSMWKVIKLNLVEKLKENQKEKKYCLTYDTTTCVTNRENFDCDNKSDRVLIGVLKKSTGEIRDIPSADEHVIYFCSAMKKPINGEKDLPKWKKLRWINWALENNVINATPGSFLRIVSIYSPFSEVVISYLLREPEPTATTEHLFNEDMYSSEGNIFELMDEDETVPQVTEKKEEVLQDSLEFNFAEIYPFLRQLEIYYRPQNFQFTINTNEIDNLVDKVSDEEEYAESDDEIKFTFKEIAGGTESTLAISEDESVDSIDSSIDYSVTFREPSHVFYLFSDTTYCKNIYFTLSIIRDLNMKYGYLICEKYDWKSVALGPLLVGIKTVGTRTCLLQLGPGVQVCRVHYSFPTVYELSITSETNFTISNIDKLHSLLSNYSMSVISQGDKMLTAFKEMMPIIPNTSGHIKFLSEYKETFYPPGYKELTIALQLKIAKDFDEVFADAFTGYIFDSALPINFKIAMIDDMKIIFRDKTFGEKFLINLDKRTKRDIATARKDLFIINIESFLPNLKLLNGAFMKHGMKPMNSKQALNLKPTMDFDSQGSDMVNSMYFTNEMQIEVLRRILNMKPEYLQLYPFMNDHYLFLKYQDYEGITEVTPVHNCFVIARLTLNIHSTKAVPCSINAQVEFPKAVLHVIDADKCERLSFPFGLSATFHLKRNKIGYTLLLCGYCDSDMLGEPLSLAWRIRTLGVNSGNILHTCDSINPYYCQLNAPDCEELHTKTVSGFYLPSSEKIVGRFIISVTKSVLATLILSVSNEQVELCLIIKGANDEIITKAEGKGCIFVPVVLLDLSCGEYNSENGEIVVFIGTIHLMSEWNLTSEELIFAKAVRSSSQKDVISIQELRDDNITSGESEEDDEELSDEPPAEKETSFHQKSDHHISTSSHSSQSDSISKFEDSISTLSYCGYDSSHTDTSKKICKTESFIRNWKAEERQVNNDVTEQSSMHEDSEFGESSIAERNHSVIKETKETSNNSVNSEDDETISSQTSLSEESNLEIEEDPFGIFGAAPLWKLSVIVDIDEEEHTFVDNDYMRYDVFQDLKSQWQIEDPERLTKGKCLREKFLDINRTDFMNLQLDPDNISISDVSDGEKNESSKEEPISLSIDATNSQHDKIMANKRQTFPTLLPLPSSNLTVNEANNTLLNDTSFVLNRKTDNTSKKLLFREFSHSEQKLKRSKDVSINKILARSKKQLEDIIFQEDSSLSSKSLSRDGKETSEFRGITCPPIPTMTETLIKEYSLPFSGKPIFKKISPMDDDTAPLTQEEFEKICSKKKVSLSRIYKKFVVPILWGISKSRAPYCLKDLPIQAYSQKRYSNKLENALLFLKNKTNLAMSNVQKEILAAEAYFHKRSNVVNEKSHSI